MQSHLFAPCGHLLRCGCVSSLAPINIFTETFVASMKAGWHSPAPDRWNSLCVCCAHQHARLSASKHPWDALSYYFMTSFWSDMGGIHQGIVMNLEGHYTEFMDMSMDQQHSKLCNWLSMVCLVLRRRTKSLVNSRIIISQGPFESSMYSWKLDY